jgi:hypothetical protein
MDLKRARKLAGIDLTRPGLSEGHISDTIVQQMGGFGRIKAMLGAKVMELSGGMGIGIRWPNKERSRGNYVEIRLEPSDTYTMEFFSVSGSSKKSVKKYEDVYFDSLVDIFEKQTGWFLSLGGSKKPAGSGRPASPELPPAGTKHEALVGGKGADEAMRAFLRRALTSAEYRKLKVDALAGDALLKLALDYGYAKPHAKHEGRKFDINALFNPPVPDYKVGDIVTQHLGGNETRDVVVTDREDNVKNGRPGFSGHVVGKPSLTVWGYDDQIRRVRKSDPRAGTKHESASKLAEMATLKSRKALWLFLKDMQDKPDAPKLKHLPKSEKNFQNETYGKASMIYLTWESPDARKAGERALTNAGFKVHDDYWPGSAISEVQVSYFKGVHWDESRSPKLDDLRVLLGED